MFEGGYDSFGLCFGAEVEDRGVSGVGGDFAREELRFDARVAAQPRREEHAPCSCLRRGSGKLVACLGRGRFEVKDEVSGLGERLDGVPDVRVGEPAIGLCDGGVARTPASLGSIGAGWFRFDEGESEGARDAACLRVRVFAASCGDEHAPEGARGLGQARLTQRRDETQSILSRVRHCDSFAAGPPGGECREQGPALTAKPVGLGNVVHEDRERRWFDAR